MHGMGYHLVAAPGCTTANGLWVCFGVGTPARQGTFQSTGCVAASLHGAWHRLCSLGGRKDAFQVYGQFQRAITDGGCGMA
jgi:hypothetical protein